MLIDVRTSLDNEFGIVQTYTSTHYIDTVTTHLTTVITPDSKIGRVYIWKGEQFIPADEELPKLYKGGFLEGFERYIRAKKPFYVKLEGVVAKYRVTSRNGDIKSATVKYYWPDGGVVDGRVSCKEVPVSDHFNDINSRVFKAIADAGDRRADFLLTQIKKAV